MEKKIEYNIRECFETIASVFFFINDKMPNQMEDFLKRIPP